MWAISKVKEIGKAAFKRNYWKAVLVALVISIGAIGAGSSSGFSIITDMTNLFSSSSSSYSDDYYYSDYSDYDDYDDFENFLDDYDGDYYSYSYDYDTPSSSDSTVALGLIAGTVLIIVIIVSLIVMAISIVATVFIFNPLGMGSHRFFLTNLKNPAQVKEVAFGFDHSYKNIVKVMFFRGLYTFLWSLLFIIPGIVKSYEYRMIPYLLAENPEMSSDEAFARSKYLMTGNKWNAFVFDLSFIGWYILCMVPFVGMFYVYPYKQSANAALYDAIRLTKGQQDGGYQPNFQQSNFQQGAQNFQQSNQQGAQNFQQSNFQQGTQNFQQSNSQQGAQNFQQSNQTGAQSEDTTNNDDTTM